MVKDFIPYNEVLELKELGFDEPCLGYYAGDILCAGQPQEIHLDKDGNYKKTKTESYPIIAAPTFSQAFRWFREKYDLCQIVIQNTDKDWTYEVMTIIGITYYEILDVLDTYEETELACLKKLIEIVKEK